MEVCLRGFKAERRPLIGLDGCHLKGHYGGQLFAAISVDGNNSFYIIAYVIVDVESNGIFLVFLINRCLMYVIAFLTHKLFKCIHMELIPHKTYRKH